MESENVTNRIPFYKNPKIIIGSAVATGVFIAILVVIIVVKSKKKVKTDSAPDDSAPETTPDEGFRERFLATADASHVDPYNPGAIKGRLTTDGMINRSWDDLVKELKDKNHISEGKHLGAGVGPSFDAAFKNQQDIATLDKKAGEGVLDPNEMSQISNKIDSSANNANNNIYNRAITTPVKLILAPTEIRGVIEEKYLGERNKNRQLATVGSIIKIEGYNVDSENLGREFDNFSTSKYSNNKKASKLARDGRGEFRSPNAVGANTGDNVRINTDTGAENTNPNPEVENIKADNGEVTIDGKKIADVDANAATAPTSDTFKARALGTTLVRG